MQVRGSLPVCDMAHVQFDDIFLGGRVGQGKGPGNIHAGNIQVQVLAGLKFNAVTRHLQPYTFNGRGQIFDPDNLAGVIFDRQVLRVFFFLNIRLYDDIRYECCTTGQGLAFVPLYVHQRKRGGFIVLDLAFQHIYLTGAAYAVIARIRQPDPGAQRGIQQFLIVFNLYRLTQRFYGCLVGHTPVPT